MYEEIKEEGFVAFPHLAKKCLALRGDKESSASHYIAVLCNDVARPDKALIIYTAQTQTEVPQEIQNIEVLLDTVHGFVGIERRMLDKETVNLFLRDAFNVKDAAVEDGHGGKAATQDYSTTLLKFTNNVVAEAVRRGASDIHYEVEESQANHAFRIDGIFNYERQMNVTEAREMMSAALQTCAPGFTGIEDDRRDIDVRIQCNVEVEANKYERIILRLSRSYIEGGYKAVMRVIRYNPVAQELSRLGYTNEQYEFLKDCLLAPFGIFLATGPVGTGKSTTLVSMYELFPQHLGGMTIEDPKEYKIHHPKIAQFEIDGNRGDAAEQATKLFKGALRKDPDLVGASEIRNAEMARLVFENSNTGTVIGSTVHTNEAILTLPRLHDLGIPLNDLASPDAWLGILNQRLMGNLCEHCSVEEDYPHIGKVWVHNENGCEHCHKGYIKGRVVCAEILQISEEDEYFILNKMWHQWREDLIRRGYKTMALRALEMAKNRQISWKDAIFKVPHAKRVHKHVEWATEGVIKPEQKKAA